MREDNFLQEMALFWQKVCYFYDQFLSFAREVKADPSRIARADLILIGAALLVVALFVLGWLIRFFTETWKEKGKMLLTALAVVLFVVAAAYFLSRYVPMPA